MKQQLLDFVNSTLTTELLLHTTEELIENTTGDNLVLGSRINKTWGTSKERALVILNDYYDDELIGHMPNDDGHITKIISWTTVVKT